MDTILTFDPAAPFEMNPEHKYTGEMAEYCCFLAGGRLDLPEQIAAGLAPYRVKEKYYWARGEQAVNRVVDISRTVKRKLESICACKNEVGNMAKSLRVSLAKQGKKCDFPEGFPQLTG